VVLYCVLVNAACLNCAYAPAAPAAPMPAYGSAPRPQDDIAAYCERLIEESACGEINATAGTRPQLWRTGDATCDITDVRWSANVVSSKGGVNGTVLTALMPASELQSFREGEPVRARSDPFTTSCKTTLPDGRLKYAMFSCPCGWAKPPGKKEKEAAAARAVKREASAAQVAAAAQPAAPQQTVAAARPTQEDGTAVAQRDSVDETECRSVDGEDGAPQRPAVLPPTVKAEPRKNGERGESAAPTKKVGCPVRFTAKLQEETCDGEPVYLVTYLEWEHAAACKVLAPRMTSEACKARLIGYFQSRPSLAAWEAVKLNCTYVATDYARLHPDVTDVGELEALWQQVR